MIADQANFLLPGVASAEGHRVFFASSIADVVSEDAGLSFGFGPPAVPAAGFGLGALAVGLALVGALAARTRACPKVRRPILLGVNDTKG